jgi:23S rRNA (uracil1939-C5)-methyltransferase
VPKFFNKVLHVDTCHLQADPSNAIRLFVGSEGHKRGLSFFDLHAQEGLLRNLVIRSNRAGELMVTLVCSRDNTAVRGLLDDLGDAFPQIVSTHLVVNTKRNSSTSDLPVLHHKGAEALEETLGSIRYRIGPKSFFQTNPWQAEKLVAIAREMADLRPSDVVYDLYTGLGSIALYVADACARVVGIEWVEEAVVDARANAARNGIENCTFHAGDMAKLLTPEFLDEHGRPDVIITDPPRAGMHDKVNQRIIESGARRVVYVSCNPVSQARDLEQLTTAYSIEKLQPVDMFPQTYHIENIALLLRREDV